MNSKMIIVLGAAVVLAGAGGFFGGRQYQKSQRQTFSFNGNANQRPGSLNGQQFQGGQRGGNGNFMRPVSGQITGIDSNTITVKSQDGSSSIVVYNSSTRVNRTTKATISDLKNGDEVTIIGTTGSDGTITASSINLGNVTFQMRQNPNPTSQ